MILFLYLFVHLNFAFRKILAWGINFWFSKPSHRLGKWLHSGETCFGCLYQGQPLCKGKETQSNGDRSSFPHYTQHKCSVFYRDIWPLQPSPFSFQKVYSPLWHNALEFQRCFAISSSATTQETPAYQRTTQRTVSQQCKRTYYKNARRICPNPLHVNVTERHRGKKSHSYTCLLGK